MAAGAFFTLGALDGAPAADVSPSPSSEPTPPDITVPGFDRIPGDWTVDWTGIYSPDTPDYSPDYLDAPESFDDGLDHADLPPLVDRPSPRYPQAHELTDEIWSHVGPGWYVAAYSYNGSINWAGIDPVPVFHLVSPEGVHFKLPDLEDPDARPGATIGYINLTERWARISTYVPETGETGFVYKWDLMTGEVLTKYQTSGDGGGNGEGDLFTVLGPFEGGGELRALESGITWEVSGERTLSFWTPESGEFPLDVPDGVTDGDAYLSMGPIDPGGTLALVSLSYSESSDVGGPWLFDSTTMEFTLLEVAAPGVDGWCWEYLSIDATSGIQRCYDGASFRYFEIPWDGSEPTEIAPDAAVSRPWATAGIEAVGVSDYMVPARFVDTWAPSRVVIFSNPPEDSGRVPVFTDVVDVGEGRVFLTNTDWYGDGGLAAYDRATGSTFFLEDSWIPDTRWLSAFSDAYVIPILPGEETAS